MLREDVREKKQLFYSAPVSKKRPRKIFFPMDEPSSKKMESYRNGPVKTTRLSVEEMFKMDAERVPNYKEFKKLSDERKREILERFKERFYTHKQMAELLQTSPYNIGYWMYKLGLSESRPGPRSRKDRAAVAQTAEVTMQGVNQTTKNGVVNMMQNRRMYMGLNGAYSPKELASRLVALASLIEVQSDEVRLNITLDVWEDEPKENEAE